MNGILFDSMTRRSALVSRRTVVRNVAAAVLGLGAVIDLPPSPRSEGGASAMPGLSCDDCLSLCKEAKPFVDTGGEAGCLAVVARSALCGNPVVCAVLSAAICLAVEVVGDDYVPSCNNICHSIDLLGFDPVCKGDKTYTSPQFDYLITYDANSFSVDKKESNAENGVDYILFDLQDSKGSIAVSGFQSYSPDPEEMKLCVGNNAQLFGDATRASNFRELADVQTDEASLPRAFATYSFSWKYNNDSSADYMRYVECRWLGDGITVVITHSAEAATYPDAVSLQQELIAGIRPPEETVYRPPHHDFIVKYDRLQWAHLRNSDDTTDDDDDRAVFWREHSDLVMHGRYAYAQDEMATCAYNVCRWFTDPSTISNLETVAKPNAEGSIADRAWTAVTLTHKDGENVTDYYSYCECRWLGDRLNLTIAHWIEVDHLEAEAQARVVLMAGFKPK